MKQITDYQIIDHGIDNSQYFPGCGTTFTDYIDVFTGAADNVGEAFEDALEQAAIAGWQVDNIENPFKEYHSICDYYEYGPSCTEEYSDVCELHYYVSIRIK